jgi:glycosyltransferase involved in cell wall biosynthesis
LTPSVTIVLPLYNAERFVHRAVRDLLDVTQATTARFRVILVDNGSTDDTYEAIYALSRCYPQITTLWQPVRSGLGSVIELIRARVTNNRILLHDGVSPICTMRLSQMLTHKSGPQRMAPVTEEIESSGLSLKSMTTHSSHRFTPVSALTENMQLAHQAVAALGSSSVSNSLASGFQWIPQAEGRTNNQSTNSPIPLGHSRCPTSQMT